MRKSREPSSLFTLDISSSLKTLQIHSKDAMYLHNHTFSNTQNVMPVQATKVVPRRAASIQTPRHDYLSLPLLP
jgi:hypothetical protein